MSKTSAAAVLAAVLVFATPVLAQSGEIAVEGAPTPAERAVDRTPAKAVLGIPAPESAIKTFLPATPALAIKMLLPATPGRAPIRLARAARLARSIAQPRRTLLRRSKQFRISATSPSLAPLTGAEPAFRRPT